MIFLFIFFALLMFDIPLIITILVLHPLFWLIKHDLLYLSFTKISFF
jgi:hypothetical protein